MSVVLCVFVLPPHPPPRGTIPFVIPSLGDFVLDDCDDPYLAPSSWRPLHAGKIEAG